MKLLLALGLTLSLVSAEQLIIDAKNFEAFDEKGFSLFQGDVKLKRGKDRLNSDKLEVYISKEDKKKKREPQKYIATGKVDFEVVSNGKHYEGKGDKVIYNPKELKYTIIGNGYLKEKVEDKTLYGDKIYINQQTGEARVHGTSKKPVRFILNIEDKEKKPEPKKEPAKPEVKAEPVVEEPVKEVVQEVTQEEKAKTETIIKKELTAEEEQMREDAKESAKKMEAMIEEKAKKEAERKVLQQENAQ